MILKQMLQVIRLLGLKRAAKMKKRHDKALTYARGYAASTVFWSLLKIGFWDELADAGAAGLDLKSWCEKHGFDHHVLDSCCSYLDGIRWVDYDHDAGRVKLTGLGADMLAEPRGLFELIYAYEPIFVELEAMARGRKKYGEDVIRRTDWVGIGSGRLCRQLPYPVMMDMVERHGCRHVLDLGCGDGALLLELADRNADLHGHGIDLDKATADLARRQIQEAGRDDRLAASTMDMFELPARHAEVAPVDCITACDTFHEYLWESEEPVVRILSQLRQTFPDAKFVIGEFCKQTHEQLRKRPTAFLEHHLFHQLTNQRVESADAWRRIFRQAGLTVVEEKIFDLVGHGYFVLE